MKTGQIGSPLHSRDKTYAVFRRDGKLVNRLDRKFYPAAWAPAPR